MSTLLSSESLNVFCIELTTHSLHILYTSHAKRPLTSLFYVDPPASNPPSNQIGLLVLVAPLTISTTAYVPLIEAVQVWRAVTPILSHADIQWHANGDVWPICELKLTPDGKRIDSCTVISGRNPLGAGCSWRECHASGLVGCAAKLPASMPVAFKIF